MSIRKAAAQFFQNIADYFNPEQGQGLLLVPDFLTGKIHNLTDPEQQRQYRNLHRFVNNGFSDNLVIVLEGQTPTARYRNSVSHMADLWNYASGQKPKDRGMGHYSDEEAHRVIAQEERMEGLRS